MIRTFVEHDGATLRYAWASVDLILEKRFLSGKRNSRKSIPSR